MWKTHERALTDLAILTHETLCTASERLRKLDLSISNEALQSIILIFSTALSLQKLYETDNISIDFSQSLFAIFSALTIQKHATETDSQTRQRLYTLISNSIKHWSDHMSTIYTIDSALRQSLEIATLEQFKSMIVAATSIGTTRTQDAANKTTLFAKAYMDNITWPLRVQNFAALFNEEGLTALSEAFLELVKSYSAHTSLAYSQIHNPPCSKQQIENTCTWFTTLFPLMQKIVLDIIASGKELLDVASFDFDNPEELEKRLDALMLKDSSTQSTVTTNALTASSGSSSSVNASTMTAMSTSVLSSNSTESQISVSASCLTDSAVS
jgi:hypothetical protein